MGVAAGERPVLIYDGDCAFCSSCARLLERIGPRAAIVPWQLADLDDLGISREQAVESVQWVGAGGAVVSGHEAIAAVLRAASAPWRLLGAALLLPGVSWLAARAYRVVADNRYQLPGGTPACARRAGPRD
jgi:predicted DCC family thiol-disulfide oxidoreductase YuxK